MYQKAIAEHITVSTRSTINDYSLILSEWCIRVIKQTQYEQIDVQVRS